MVADGKACLVIQFLELLHDQACWQSCLFQTNPLHSDLLYTQTFVIQTAISEVFLLEFEFRKSSRSEGRPFALLCASKLAFT